MDDGAPPASSHRASKRAKVKERNTKALANSRRQSMRSDGFNRIQESIDAGSNRADATFQGGLLDDRIRRGANSTGNVLNLATRGQKRKGSLPVEIPLRDRTGTWSLTDQTRRDGDMESDTQTKETQVDPKAASKIGPRGYKKAYKACITCRERKARCELGPDLQPPCHKCRRELRECVFSKERSWMRSRDQNPRESSKQPLISNILERKCLSICSSFASSLGFTYAKFPPCN